MGPSPAYQAINPTIINPLEKTVFIPLIILCTALIIVGISTQLLWPHCDGRRNVISEITKPIKLETKYSNLPAAISLAVLTDSTISFLALK